MNSTHTATPDAIRGCHEALEHCLALVDALTDAQYCEPIEGFSSIGAHMRHCVEHFQCFFAGLPNGSADYDARARDRDIETSRDVLRATVRQLADSLAQLEGADLDAPITVIQTPAIDAPPAPFSTTIARELMFLSSHSIHHMAVMKVLARLLDCQIAGNVGVAYSTQAWRKSTGQQA